MTRSKGQRDRDRADLMAVLSEEGPLRATELIAKALGYPTWDLMLQAYTPELWLMTRQAGRDLAALRRAGVLASHHDPAYYTVEWRLATDEDVAVDEDMVDVARMAARWEPARRAAREPDPLDRSTWETTSRSIVYLYACPTCKARTGDWCRTRSGRITRPHPVRRSRVRPAW